MYTGFVAVFVEGSIRPDFLAYVGQSATLTMRERKQLRRDAFDSGITVSMLNVDGDSRTDILISTST